MTESTALIIQAILMGLSGLVAVVAGIVYVKTEGNHGGVICVIFGIITLSIGAGVYDATQEVLK